MRVNCSARATPCSQSVILKCVRVIVESCDRLREPMLLISQYGTRSMCHPTDVVQSRKLPPCVRLPIITVTMCSYIKCTWVHLPHSPFTQPRMEKNLQCFSAPASSKLELFPDCRRGLVNLTRKNSSGLFSSRRTL